MKITIICTNCFVEIGQFEVAASDLKPVGNAKKLYKNNNGGQLISYAICENCASGDPALGSGDPEKEN